MYYVKIETRQPPSALGWHWKKHLELLSIRRLLQQHN